MSIFRCGETIAAPKKYVKRHIEERLTGGARYRAAGKAADGELPTLMVRRLGRRAVAQRRGQDADGDNDMDIIVDMVVDISHCIATVSRLE